MRYLYYILFCRVFGPPYSQQAVTQCHEIFHPYRRDHTLFWPHFAHYPNLKKKLPRGPNDES